MPQYQNQTRQYPPPSHCQILPFSTAMCFLSAVLLHLPVPKICHCTSPLALTLGSWYWGLCFWSCYNCYDLMWFDSCLILYDSEEVCHALLHVRCPNDTGQLVCDKSEFCQIRIAVTCHNDSERSTVRQLMNWWHVLRFTILAMAVAGWGTLLCVHASVARLLGHVCLLAFSLHSTLYYYMSQNIIYKFPCMSTLLTLCCWIVPCFLRSIFK